MKDKREYMKNYMVGKKMVNFVIDDEVWKEFKALAKKKGLSASAMLRNYIVSKVEREMREKNEKR